RRRASTGCGRRPSRVGRLSMTLRLDTEQGGGGVRAPSRYIATAVLASTVVTACVAARMTTARPAEASAAHKYTLRIGVKVAIPTMSQVCSVYVEGGAVELFCAR